MTTQDERQAAWDAKIVSDLRAEIAMIELAIKGQPDSALVRLPLGDSRVETVASHKAAIRRKHCDIAQIEGGK